MVNQLGSYGGAEEEWTRCEDGMPKKGRLVVGKTETGQALKMRLTESGLYWEATGEYGTLGLADVEEWRPL